MLKFLEQSSCDDSVVTGNALDADLHTKPGWVYSRFRVFTSNIPVEGIIMHLFGGDLWRNDRTRWVSRSGV